MDRIGLQLVSVEFNRQDESQVCSGHPVVDVSLSSPREFHLNTFQASARSRVGVGGGETEEEEGNYDTVTSANLEVLSQILEEVGASRRKERKSIGTLLQGATKLFPTTTTKSHLLLMPASVFLSFCQCAQNVGPTRSVLGASIESHLLISAHLLYFCPLTYVNASGYQSQGCRYVGTWLRTDKQFIGEGRRRGKILRLGLNFGKNIRTPSTLLHPVQCAASAIRFIFGVPHSRSSVRWTLPILSCDIKQWRRRHQHGKGFLLQGVV